MSKLITIHNKINFNDEMIYEMDHIWIEDMKSSEAMIIAVRVSHRNRVERTNDQLPKSVAS